MVGRVRHLDQARVDDARALIRSLGERGEQIGALAVDDLAQVIDPRFDRVADANDARRHVLAAFAERGEQVGPFPSMTSRRSSALALIELATPTIRAETSSPRSPSAASRSAPLPSMTSRRSSTLALIELLTPTIRVETSSPCSPSVATKSAPFPSMTARKSSTFALIDLETFAPRAAQAEFASAAALANASVIA